MWRKSIKQWKNVFWTFFKGASQFLKSDITLQGEFPFEWSLGKFSYRKYFVWSKIELFSISPNCGWTKKSVNCRAPAVSDTSSPTSSNAWITTCKIPVTNYTHSMDADWRPGDENTAWSSSHLMGNCNYCRVRKSDISNFVLVLLIHLPLQGLPLLNQLTLHVKASCFWLSPLTIAVWKSSCFLTTLYITPRYEDSKVWT